MQNTKLLTCQQAADFLNIKVDTLYRRKKNRFKSIPIIQTGPYIRFKLDDLEKYIEEHTKEEFNAIKQVKKRLDIPAFIKNEFLGKEYDEDYLFIDLKEIRDAKWHNENERKNLADWLDIELKTYPDLDTRIIINKHTGGFTSYIEVATGRDIFDLLVFLEELGYAEEDIEKESYKNEKKETAAMGILGALDSLRMHGDLKYEKNKDGWE